MYISIIQCVHTVENRNVASGEWQLWAKSISSEDFHTVCKHFSSSKDMCRRRLVPNRGTFDTFVFEFTCGNKILISKKKYLYND